MLEITEWWGCHLALLLRLVLSGECLVGIICPNQVAINFLHSVELCKLSSLLREWVEQRKSELSHLSSLSMEVKMCWWDRPGFPYYVSCLFVNSSRNKTLKHFRQYLKQINWAVRYAKDFHIFVVFYERETEIHKGGKWLNLLKVKADLKRNFQGVFIILWSYHCSAHKLPSVTEIVHIKDTLLFLTHILSY